MKKAHACSHPEWALDEAEQGGKRMRICGVRRVTGSSGNIWQLLAAFTKISNLEMQSVMEKT